MNKIIIPTGYMGSGSSAIADLLHEYKSYELAHVNFEYIFLHCPNGVFDLEDKLLIGNNALRSDEALHSFLDEMWKLYHSKFWWPGNYKKNLHTKFWEVTQEYVEALTQFKPNNYWYRQEEMNPTMFIKMGIRKIARVISGGRLILKRPLKYSPMLVSFINSDEFYEISRSYISNIMDLLGIQEQNLILDQLLLPHNLWRMEHYFDKNAFCIVVERDPRDMFICNKYFWTKKGDDCVVYPTDAVQFCDYYKQVRQMERTASYSNIYRIHFEDLIYRYDETVSDIEKILDIDSDLHCNKKMFFNPNKSIHNTQLFKKQEYREDAIVIEELLPEYLYDFPYDFESNTKQVF